MKVPERLRKRGSVPLFSEWFITVSTVSSLSQDLFSLGKGFLEQTLVELVYPPLQ